MSDSRVAARTDRLRILLADPQTRRRSASANFLERLGHEVQTVASGTEAVQSSEQTDFDLILVELRLPGLDPLATVNLIRANQHRRGGRVRIVGLSEPGQRVDQRRAIEAGMDDCLNNSLNEQSFDKMLHVVRPVVEPILVDRTNFWSLDPESIRAAFPMAPSALSLVVRLFRESCVERLGRMEEDLKSADLVGVAQGAHALRGSLGMFASASTLRILVDLENEARQGDLDSARQLLPRLVEAIANLKPTLDQLEAETGDPPDC